MEFVDTQLGYHQRHSDGKHPNYYAQDGMDPSVDPPLLEADIIPSPRQSHFRKDSFANSSGVLSPTDSHGWEHNQFLGRPVEPTSNPYEDAGAQSHLHGTYPPAYMQQSHSHPTPWKFEQSSGNSTPSTSTDMMPPPPRFDDRYPFRGDSGHAVFNQPGPSAMNLRPHHYTNVQQSPVFAGPQQVQTPLSPHSHHDWMEMEHQEAEVRAQPKHIRPNSVDLSRRDGIRKKNSRIDIPSERNIHTIDELIDKTTDEDMLKELKQQKRLLRNREAALASRQRKKRHTEDLEVKEKNFNREIAGLRNSVAEMTNQRRRWEEDRETLLLSIQARDQEVEKLRAQIREKCEESSSLRGKINVLTDQLDAVSIPMSAAPSSASYTDFNAGMEALNVGRDDWDSYLFPNNVLGDPDELTFDPRPEQEILPPTLKKQTSTSTIVPAFQKTASDILPEQPVAASSMILVMLLLGAWISSRPGATQARDIPSMPAEVHAAAPAVLHNLLSGAGPTMLNDLQMLHQPQPSEVPQAISRNNNKFHRMQDNHSPFASHQEQPNTFGSSSASYSLETPVNPSPVDARPPASTSRGHRRNIAEALSQTQQQDRQIKGDMYTRGLIWEQIPTEILTQFRELVREREQQDEIHAHRAKQPTGSGM